MKIILAKEKKNYASCIVDKGLFDIIIVDGKYRKECIDVCIKQLKRGGFLIFDNLEQLDYEKIFDSIRGSKKEIVAGLIPSQGGYCKAGIYHNM